MVAEWPGLIYSMEVQILPECEMYYNSADCGILKAMDYGWIMTRTRFETILANLQPSKSQDRNQQVLDFTVNTEDFHFLNESMIK